MKNFIFLNWKETSHLFNCLQEFEKNYVEKSNFVFFEKQSFFPRIYHSNKPWTPPPPTLNQQWREVSFNHENHGLCIFFAFILTFGGARWPQNVLFKFSLRKLRHSCVLKRQHFKGYLFFYFYDTFLITMYIFLFKNSVHKNERDTGWYWIE